MNEHLNALHKGAKELSKKNSGKGKKIIIIIICVIIIIGILVFVGTYLNPTFIANKRKNFPNDRCTDFISYHMPSYFGPKGMTYAKNKQFCDSAAINAAHKKNISPITGMINKQQDAINGIHQHIVNTNKMIFHIRDGIEQEARDVQQKLYNTYKRLAYVFKVFARLFYRVFTVYRDVFETLKYAIWTLMSVWNGPIGKFFRFFSCFGEETLIKVMRNNELKVVKISDLELGDLEGKNRVNGVCEFYLGDDVYNLDGVNVCGSHLVEYNAKPIRVKKHPNAQLVKYPQEKIYNFITTTGRMNINNYNFRDYLGDNTLETYNKILQVLLPEKPLKDWELERYEESAVNLYPAFSCDSTLETNKGVKRVEDIKLGDKIDGKKVVGKIKLKLEGKTFVTNYQIGNVKGMHTGIQIFHRDGKYFVEQQEERWILGNIFCIGFIIEGGLINMGSYSIAHFDIVNEQLAEKAEKETYGI